MLFFRRRPTNSWKRGLVAYWRLDETSGSRLDSSGNGHTLTDNNTVTSGAGKVGTAAVFTRASSERLSRADQPAFEVGAASWGVGIPLNAVTG